MIPPIYIMAAITLIVALALWGALIYLFAGRQKGYFWLLALGLPFSAIANLILKQQAIILVGQTFHVRPGLGLAAPAWFLACNVLVTPLVEEPLKVLPLLFRPVWKMVTSRASALWVGFVLGVGFGLGEAIYLAFMIAQGGQYNSLPWYAFTGYMNERLYLCFAHGVLTAVLATGIQRRGWFILSGILSALGLHLLLNAPTVMYSFKWISLEIYSFSLIIPFIVLAVTFERMRRAAREPKDDLRATEIVYWQRQGKIG